MRHHRRRIDSNVAPPSDRSSQKVAFFFAHPSCHDSNKEPPVPCCNLSFVACLRAELILVVVVVMERAPTSR